MPASVSTDRIAFAVPLQWAAGKVVQQLLAFASRLLASFGGVVAVTLVASHLVPVNATTAGFAYLILILLIASTWGFTESVFASLVATLAFNFFFLPPLRTFTIADPQNWAALFSFLTTSLVAGRLSTKVKERAREAVDRQRDLERLYSFSRAILLIDASEPFSKQLVFKLADIFYLDAVVLFDRRHGEYFRAGQSEFEGLDEQLRSTALSGVSFSDPPCRRTITAVRLGSDPIGSLALQGSQMPDSVVQGIANLVAIGLERANAQNLTHQIEVARQSEQLRTTLIDAMAHEFKTPLTSIRGATTALLSVPDQSIETRTELLKIADEEAEHLRKLIDDATEMARLDTSNIDVKLEQSDIVSLVREVISAMEKGIDSRPIETIFAGQENLVSVDQRLIRLAVKQLIENALKYSAPDSPVTITVHAADENMFVEVTDRGSGIPASEQAHVFDRFWRSPSVIKKMPGSGLGLSIAHSIAHAHGGDLTVDSHPGKTTFRLSLPLEPRGGRP